MKFPRWVRLAGAASAAAALPLVAIDRLHLRRPVITAEPGRSNSYWMTTIPAIPRFPQLEHDLDVDVAVVGGGFTGLATAYYLKVANPDLRVALLESQRLGSGSSSRNSGAVAPRFRGHDASDISHHAYQLLKTFAETEQIEFGLQENVPAIYLHHRLPRGGDPKLSGEQLAREIASRYYAAADITATNSVHPGKLVAGLIQANARVGVDLYEYSPVVEIERSSPLALTTTHGRVQARDVALATNAYSQQLGIASDILLTIHHRVLVTRPLNPTEWEMSGLERWPLRFETGGYFTHTVRSTPDRRFFFRHVLGHRAFEAPDWEIDHRARKAGQRELLRRYPWLEGVPVEFEWHGITARTRDWWPVSGQIDEHLYLAVGYNGSGIMPTHYFGYLMANRILGKEQPGFELFRPPAAHRRIPGKLSRHVVFQGWLNYRRLRDG
ncbi:MAG TPA: FAD-binding oxidoreductase [Nitrolancea sp.]|jgi:glycine/D-amino acid oxidase-like deaminating enzyme|nr:FAD-binding oxidoreductase [Nitrolancea sp.]